MRVASISLAIGAGRLGEELLETDGEPGISFGFPIEAANASELARVVCKTKVFVVVWKPDA
ncbi:MAG: hypothetical protein V4684_12415 [Pseudomonadota bacterium]